MTGAASTSRILTLVFTDLADSTALKAQQGDQAVGELVTRHREHLRRIAIESNGRIIDWAGDGCFLTFEAPSAAVSFALRLEQAHADDSDLPGVRVGIHMGEVSERPGPDGDGVHPRVEGLAVDLAARISGLARPRQVLMSSSVADSARPRLDSHAFDRPILWRTHGSYRLKGFGEALEIREAGLEGIAPFTAPVPSEKAMPVTSPPTTGGKKRLRLGVVAAISLVAVAWLVWWTTFRPHESQPPTAAPSVAMGTPAKKSIAVLPFVNMSSDKENEYFSDGITEDLITALSKVSGLHVAARTSSFAFKGKNEDVRTIGTQLNVGAVLEGSVAKAGNKVRITAQLINAADGYHLWSDSYDRELQDIFAIRSQVAQTVARALEVALGGSERQALEQKPTGDLEAYQLYLKGRHAAATFADYGTALRYLQQAIARDPSYALAYLGLAYYYTMAIDYPMSGSDALPRARKAAERALELDPSLAEAHVWLACARWWHDHDYVAARRELQTATTMQPELASAHEIYGLYLISVGQPNEGLEQSRRAVELDPLSPETTAFLGLGLYYCRRYVEALEQSRKALDVDADYGFARYLRSYAYARLGDWARARDELLRAAKTTGSSQFPDNESALARIHSGAGDRMEASKTLAHLLERSRHEYIPAYCVALLHVALGNTDQAFEWLARAESQRSWNMGWLKVDPELDPVRADPRFAELLKKVGLDR